MSTTFNVTIRATSITVYPGQESMTLLQPLIDLLTYEDEFVEETKTLGYMYDDDTDTLYLHKGIDPNYLKRLLINVEFSYDLYHEYRKMNFEYDEIIAPRNDEQVDVINFIAGLNQHSSNIDESQLFLVRRPGFGKCEPYSNKIPTPTCDGYTLMGDIKLGDYVFGKDGYLTKVIQIFEQGEKDVYEVLEALVQFKEELYKAIESGNAMDLTYEEKAFFDVLTADPEVIAMMEDDILIKIAKDLTKTVKENLCPAWHERKQAQAKMRMKIKKLLKKYDYPPNKSEKAVEDVMEQVTLQCVAGL